MFLLCNQVIHISITIKYINKCYKFIVVTFLKSAALGLFYDDDDDDDDDVFQRNNDIIK